MSQIYILYVDMNYKRVEFALLIEYDIRDIVAPAVLN